VFFLSQCLGDGNGEIREVSVRILPGSEIRVRPSEEGLCLNASDPARITSTKDQAIHLNDALTTNEQLEFTVGLTNVIQSDSLADSGPRSSFKMESASTNGGTVGRVAIRKGSNVALLLVGSESWIVERRKITVKLPSTIYTPHKTSRETCIRPSSTRARQGRLIIISSIKARKLSTFDPVKALLKKDRVSKGCFFCSGQIDILRSRGIERETTLGEMLEIVGSLGIIGLHGWFSIRRVNVFMRKRFQHIHGTESRVGQRKRVI